MSSFCEHDWRNSIRINKQGTLDSIIECEECGVRQYVDSDRPEHLKYVPTKRYESLKKLFEPHF